MENLTPWQALFDLLLWGLIVLDLLPATKYPYRLSKQRRIIGFTLVMIFCLFPFWGGDYFHYAEAFDTIKHGGYSAFEEFYQWVIINVADNYFVFRFIVWGLALLMLFYAYKRVGQTPDLSLFYFAAFYLPWFSYARASLAMSCIILGLSFLSKPFKKSSFLSIIIGVALIGCSVFFHRSAVLGIAAFLVSLVFVKSNKTKLIIIIMLFPFLIYFMTQLMDIVMGVDAGDLDFVFSQRKREGYLNDEYSQPGLAATIGAFLNRSPVLIMPIVYLFLVFKGRYSSFNRIEKIISTYTISIILMSLGFVFVEKYNTNTLFYRTLLFAYPANAIILSSIKSRNIGGKWFNVLITISLLSSLYSLLYSLYCSLVK